MATNHQHVSALSRGLSNEGWESLVAWDDELFDPIFLQGDTDLTENNYGVFTSDFHVPESVPSAATSFIDDPSSFEYATSAPPSIIDGHSSMGGPTYSWLSTSPSFSTPATSPLAARRDRAHYGSFNTHDCAFSPVREEEDPILDTRQTLLPQNFGCPESLREASPSNPFIANFSGRDISVSHAFSNVGTWADQSHVEPIPEMDHEGAIPIPQLSFQGPSNVPSSAPWCGIEEFQPEQPRALAITIPRPNRRQGSTPSLWVQQGQAALSVSPESKRRPRMSLSRSVSRSEPRRSVTKNSMTTPSPTSNAFVWVAYQPNHDTNRLVPSGTEGRWGRRQRGRTKGLTAEQRQNAALMRIVKSCSNCKRRKEKCDPGIPCKSCLEHYKGDLINFPCRDRSLSDLSKAFLSDRLGWHPTARPLEAFVSPNAVDISTIHAYAIPLNFGFGPILQLSVHALQIKNTNALYHEHIIYSWPPSKAPGDTHLHAVLPAVLTPEALSTLPDTLDTHLSLLVTQHFRSFPLYCSPLRILREIYIFYRSLSINTPSSRLIHQALKLLVLVHIGGDLTLPSPTSDATLEQLIRTTMPENVQRTTPTPCFIRSQLGSVMPTLAQKLMNEVLSSLELLLLNRECSEWPIALAVLLVVLMTVESTQYHAAKVAYHHSYDSDPSTSQQPTGANEGNDDHTVDDADIKSLLTFYLACFSGCHARLKPDWRGESKRASPLAIGPEDRFVESVREAVKRASPDLYLAGKAGSKRQGEDMGFFFDRLVARVLVLRT
ncbi:hypothetical protein K504DRAFT_431113 [Pleomassaria siparia CBS 279.74]|uniref:Zn(2)-C6 fungal-type domain-containing protein n=1 Tax=Pleomassaria siparia CBS 279.74 TaxID=1314801 RepID=A0A6G1KDR0_9PLEO|nr:hypothetical protein K504DRAFT_431113 [Pleomassaria siparia CBS 279.74]